MATEPLLGYPYPAGTDLLSAGDDAIRALAEAVRLRSVMYFASAAARTAAFTAASLSPSNGMLSYLDDVARLDVFKAAAWRPVSPTSYEAACSTNVNVAAAVADVPGASITFSTVATNAVVDCHWIAHFDANAAVATTGLCFLAIDGVDTPNPSAAFEIDAANNEGATVAQVFQTTLAAAGSHTIKLRCQKQVGASDTALRLFNTSTRLQISVRES